MKKNSHPIDDFFREALGDHTLTPSSASRKAFLKDASKFTKQRSLNGKQVITLIIILIAVISGIIVYYPKIEGRDKTTRKTSKSQQEKSTQWQASVSKPENVKNEILFYNQSSAIITKTSIKSMTRPGQNDKIHEKDHLIAEKERCLPVPETSNPASETRGEEPGDDSISLSPRSNDSLKQEMIEKETAHPEETPEANSQKKEQSAKKSLSEVEWRISAGVYYAPEWIFNTLEGTKPGTNFGIEGTYRFGRYSIRTGIGLSVTKGTNQLSIEYNEYLGSYAKLDSMTFSWDERHYYLLPTYYLSNKDVFDSLMKLDNAKIIKRYTYLQIPLVFGYDFYETGNFSMGLRLGPVLSILLTSKTISDPYDPGNNQIISINNITPEQVNLNWQVTGGLNLSYRFGKRFGVEIEPFGKYYFNSVYEFSGSSKPWSIGIRGAIFISF